MDCRRAFREALALAMNNLKRVPHARKPQGFLSRLRHNTRGNALAIAAASMIPITAAIGAGVDISRVYATRIQMQQACDAGVLAIRRSILNNTIDATSRALGLQFYRVNFPPSTFGTTSVTEFTTSMVANTNAVSGTATVTLPYAMMGVVGLDHHEITVTCQASQDFVNTDIVLVLDNTRSMNCLPTESANTDCQTEKTNSKMDGQREAVLALYDALSTAQAQLAAKQLRLRYAFIPYGGTVNVGKLLYGNNNSLSAIRASSNYQQCTAYDSRSNCTTYASRLVTHDQTWLANWASSAKPALGCIEERQTVNSITSSTTSIPTGAWDLDIDKLPVTTNVNTQWAPYDAAANQYSTEEICPAPAKQFDTYGRQQVSDYLDTLFGGSHTYSDIGMTWGARFITNAGVFGNQQSPETFNNYPVSKYIILMTDGFIDSDATTYSAWGAEPKDHRVAATYSDTNETNSHKRRFSLACAAAKSKNASIWVIGFGAGVGNALDQTYIDCASSADQAKVAPTSAELKTIFSSIGRQIGSLRITQ
jgi:Flp pilus assembly protein TadG